MSKKCVRFECCEIDKKKSRTDIKTHRSKSPARGQSPSRPKSENSPSRSKFVKSPTLQPSKSVARSQSAKSTSSNPPRKTIRDLMIEAAEYDEIISDCRPNAKPLKYRAQVAEPQQRYQSNYTLKPSASKKTENSRKIVQNSLK